MAKRRPWVLDTGTKGTGAQMVPLEKVLKPPARPRARAASSLPNPARGFKVVDVMTAEGKKWRLLTMEEQKALWERSRAT